MIRACSCCRRNIRAFFKICFSFYQPFCYITNHLMTVPLGNSEFCFPRLRLGKQNSLYPSGPVIKCILSNATISKPAKFARATKRTLEWVIYNVKGYLNPRWRLVTIDLRSKSCVWCVLETSLTTNFAADLSLKIFNNH